MRVLVVDDSEMVRRVLVAMIRKLGHEACEAGTAAEALAAPDCDIVLLDHSLPDRPGPEVATELRARGCAAAIYGISGHDDAEERFAGCDLSGHVSKPVQLEQLAAVLGVARAQARLGSAKLALVAVRGALDEIPTLLEGLDAATDPAEVRRLAHTIDGAMRFLEAPAARAAARALEESAKEGRIDDSARIELARAWEALRPHLSRLLR